MCKIRKVFITIIALVFAIAIIANIALALNPTPKPFPTVRPTGGGGGGGGGGGYTPPPPEVYPKYADIHNSTGAIIGNITQSSASNVTFWAEQPATVNGQVIIVRVEGKLNNMPPDPKLDIVGEAPDVSKLPAEISYNNILAQITLIRFSSGWSIQAGNLNLTLKLPYALAQNVDLGKSVVVRYDGTVYDLLHPSVAGPDASGIVTFTFASPHEPFKYDSFSTYMLTTGELPTPTPTPVPPVSPTPTTETGLSPLTILMALILVGLVAVVFIMYFLMQRKQ